MKNKLLYFSKMYRPKSFFNTTLIIYKAKKLVYILSSMHETVFVDHGCPENYQK